MISRYSQEKPCIGVSSLTKLATVLKKRLQRRFFPVNIVKILRTSILKNISERLLLRIRWKGED